MLVCRMTQRLTLLAQGQNGHDAVAAAAGFDLAANTRQLKATGLPKAPQRLGVTKADRKIIQPLCLLTLLLNQPAGDALLTHSG
ncbi:hypothetical protein D3C81_2189090 [compost metagenome]